MGHSVGFRTGAASLFSSMTTTILVGVALGGCGGAGGGSHSATGHSSASHPAGTHPGGSPQTAAVDPNNPTTGGGSPTKAQATAFADAVNLTAGDLPGYTVSPTAESALQAASESAELYRCAGVADWRPPVAEVSSKTFMGSGPEGEELIEGEEQIRSSVAMMPTAALAARDLAAIRSKGGEACLEKALSKGASEGSGGQTPYVSVSRAEDPLKASDVDGSFEYEMSTSVSQESGATLVHWIDILGFVKGPAEVTLTAGGSSGYVAPETEQHLLSVLFKRAQAANRG
jgi:hypothetical protein